MVQLTRLKPKPCTDVRTPLLVVHVAKTTVELLIDYCKNTPSDALRSAASVEQRIQLIENNLNIKDLKESAEKAHEFNN